MINISFEKTLGKVREMEMGDRLNRLCALLHVGYHMPTMDVKADLWMVTPTILGLNQLSFSGHYIVYSSILRKSSSVLHKKSPNC